MADIELVIKMDEKLYKDIYSNAEIMIYGGMRSGKTLLATLLRAIRNSKPLPKGHGRLIDADRFLEMYETCGYIEDMEVDYFNSVIPTIIEADKEDE